MLNNLFATGVFWVCNHFIYIINQYFNIAVYHPQVVNIMPAVQVHFFKNTCGNRCSRCIFNDFVCVGIRNLRLVTQVIGCHNRFHALSRNLLHRKSEKKTYE